MYRSALLSRISDFLHPTQAAREKADFLKSYEDRLANVTQQSKLENLDSTRRAHHRAVKIRENEMSQRQNKNAKAYEPYAGSKTTLQARLAALAQNLDSRTAEG